MQANDLMRMQLDKIKNTKIELGQKLAEILYSGFVFEDECIFLKYFYERKGNAEADLFQDRTGYEAFVNHFHMSDYCKNNFLSQSLRFAEGLLHLYSNTGCKNRIIAIIAIDEDDCVIRFYKDRVGEEYISGDLNDYNRPILILKSSDKQDQSFLSFNSQ